MKMDSQRILNAAAAVLHVLDGSFEGADGGRRMVTKTERLVGIDVVQTVIDADCDLTE